MVSTGISPMNMGTEADGSTPVSSLRPLSGGWISCCSKALVVPRRPGRVEVSTVGGCHEQHHEDRLLAQRTTRVAIHGFVLLRSVWRGSTC